MAPSAPVSEGNDLGDRDVVQRWTDNATNETGYRVERSTAGVGGPFTAVATLPAGEALADATGEAGPVDPAAAQAEQAKSNIAEMMAAMEDMASAGTDEAKRQAATERLKAAQLAIRQNDLKTQSDHRNAQLEAALPEEWRQIRSVVKDGPEADLVVRLGDIDNMGFGWPEGFIPFTGKSTPRHDFPYLPEDDDPDGTDRIMVVSGRVSEKGRQDGYTENTTRPSNNPQLLVLEYDLQGIEVTTVALQLFVDDFQAPVWGTRLTQTRMFMSADSSTDGRAWSRPGARRTPSTPLRRCVA